MNSDFGTAIVNKLPWPALVAVLFFFAGALLYVVSHIKRDKQGKWYWYSAAYEGSKQGGKQLKQLLDAHIIYDEGVNKKQDEYLMENYMGILKLQLWNECLSIGDRIFAGLRYIKAGGNSESKHETERLVLEHPDIYKTVVALKPDVAEVLK